MSCQQSAAAPLAYGAACGGPDSSCGRHSETSASDSSSTACNAVQVITVPAAKQVEAATIPQKPERHQDQQGGTTHDHPAACLAPPQIYQHIADAGAAKPRNSLLRELVLGVMAGMYVGIGFSLCMLCAGQLSAELRANQPGLFNLMYAVFGFPLGLTMVVINGASLFTSNVAYMTAAVIERKATLLQLAFNWVLSWLANLCGSLWLVQLMVWGEVFEGRSQFTVNLALAKTSHSFGVVLVRGILCNWLVCLAIWMANAAHDVAGKVLAIFLPISAFVAMGYEHCIANQFLLSLSVPLGSGLTVGKILGSNLVPATIGNCIGGAIFVAGSYSLAYGSPERVISAAAHSACARAVQALRRRRGRAVDAGSAAGAPTEAGMV